MRSTISTLVTNTVVLGSGGYGSALLVSASGTVAPVAAGATGIYAPSSLSMAMLQDQALILGSAAPGAARR